MIFVTGASGFIGHYVIEELVHKKEDVIVLVRDKKNYQSIGDEIVLQGDLSETSMLPSLLIKYPIKTCIHLAWEGIPDYSYEASKKNLIYGMNILELCRSLNIPNLIITGSCWEYENPIGKISENADISYANHFKAAKNSLRMISDAFCRENGIHLNWLRLFYVYGVGQRKGSLIPYIIDTFEQGKQPELNGAYNKNDFIYVSDVAKAIVACMEKKPEKTVLNIGSGKASEVLDIVKFTAKKLEVTLDTSAYSIPEKITNFYADIQLAQKYLGWNPRISLEDGIQEMIKK